MDILFSLKNNLRGETIMKKKIVLFVSMLLLFITTASNVALGEDGGEMGIFGGISEGTNLPYTMDRYVDSGVKKDTTFDYREVIFLTGVPIELKGTITVDKGKVDYIKSPTGTYTEKYTVNASNSEKKVQLNRSITFTTSYRVVEGSFKRQIVTQSVVTRWTDVITVDGKTYTLSYDQSSFTKSSIQDLTPGVSYYNSDVSYHAKYIDTDGKELDLFADGKTYGYQQLWSKVETQTFNLKISKDGGATYETVVTLNPTFEAKKTIYFEQADPFPISFGGTYNQRLERESTLSYTITAGLPTLTNSQKQGQIIIKPANAIEKLPIPEELDFMQGHWAEEDIKKLYSMEIFTETPRPQMQYEAMPRGEFIKALCLAMAIDTSKYEKITKNSPQVFADVPTSHPLYKYIMAAYDAKLIVGVGENFAVDTPISRQEAFTIYVRVIGLERLGVTNSPQTPFTDDAAIASWAKKEIMAGYKLGIIKGDANGKVLPTKWISKVEAGAIINRLVDFLREEIAMYYKQ